MPVEAFSTFDLAKSAKSSTVDTAGMTVALGLALGSAA
jgi:hypothetical protein